MLRGTVETFLQTHDVYITDWVDARMVPLSLGRFDLDDYIDYVIEMCEFLDVAGGPPVHVLAVCQPSVPVLAAMARMEAENSPHVPASMTLKGGPIDTRRNPTAVNKLAEKRGPRMVPPQLHPCRAVSLSGRRAARSIPASCSFPASWR